MVLNPGQVLRQLGIRPRKRLGQNFLLDRGVLGKIITAAELAAEDQVLEVGPGVGILTQELAGRCQRVLAVELDDRLAGALRGKLAAFPNVTVINQNILDHSPSDHFSHQGYKVVANLPYYITSPVLRHFLENPCKPELMVVMVQMEVAQRIVAGPGDMSLLAVSVQVYGEARITSTVPPEAFYPPPKVHSAIVRIQVYERPAIATETGRFFRTVRAGFCQPRKQLANSLAQDLGVPPRQVGNLLGGLSIDPKRRAETLSLAEWEAVAGKLGEEGYLD